MMHDKIGFKRYVRLTGFSDLCQAQPGPTWDIGCGHDWLGLPAGFTSGTAAQYLQSTQHMAPLVAQVEALASSLKVPTVHDVRRRLRWQDQGDELNRDRMFEGRLETAWRAAKRTRSANPPRVAIIADVLVSAGVGVESLKWRGIAALALAKALKGAGYSLSVHIGWRGPGLDGAHWTLGCEVVPFGSPVDVATLCAAVVHPATFRALGHGVQYKLTKVANWQCTDNLQDAPDSDLARVGVPTQPGVQRVWIPRDCLTEQQARSYATGILTELEAR